MNQDGGRTVSAEDISLRKKDAEIVKKKLCLQRDGVVQYLCIAATNIFLLDVSWKCFLRVDAPAYLHFLCITNYLFWRLICLWYSSFFFFSFSWECITTCFAGSVKVLSLSVCCITMSLKLVLYLLPLQPTFPVHLVLLHSLLHWPL